MLAPAMRRRSILEIHNKEKTYCGCIVWRSAIGRLMKMQRIRAKLVLKSSCTALLPLHLISSSTKCWFSQWTTIVFSARPPDLFYACKNLAKRWLTCNFLIEVFRDDYNWLRENHKLHKGSKLNFKQWTSIAAWSELTTKWYLFLQTRRFTKNI